MKSPGSVTEVRDPRGSARRRLVEREILERAAELFAHRGFAGTTVQDIADALGMSRPALYYYVDSKEALLERVVENTSRRDAQELARIAAEVELSPAGRLEAMVRQVAGNAASNPHQTRVLAQSKHHLPAAVLELDRDAERSILQSFRQVIVEGAERGQFRSVDARTAALAILGMSIWTAWWVGKASPEDVARQIAEQAVCSVMPAGGDPGVNDPMALLRETRTNLDRLERAMQGHADPAHASDFRHDSRDA